MTIVIVDGTWGQVRAGVHSDATLENEPNRVHHNDLPRYRQARRMGLRLPLDLPRLVITPDAPTLNVVRQQSRHDRICTLEATAVLIKVRWRSVRLTR